MKISDILLEHQELTDRIAVLRHIVSIGDGDDTVGSTYDGVEVSPGVAQLVCGQIRDSMLLPLEDRLRKLESLEVAGETEVRKNSGKKPKEGSSAKGSHKGGQQPSD